MISFLVAVPTVPCEVLADFLLVFGFTTGWVITLAAFGVGVVDQYQLLPATAHD